MNATASRMQVVLNYLLIFLCSAIAIYPLIGVLMASFYPSGQGVSPSGFGLPRLRVAELHDGMEPGAVLEYFTTSIIVAAVMVPSSVALSILGGYAFATMRFPGSKVIFTSSSSGSSSRPRPTIVPCYDVQAMGLIDTYWALIVLEVSGEVAFGIFWMRAAFLSAPQSLLEAARIDGASSWRTLWRSWCRSRGRQIRDAHGAHVRRPAGTVLPRAGVHDQPHDGAGRARELLRQVRPTSPSSRRAR